MLDAVKPAIESHLIEREVLIAAFAPGSIGLGLTQKRALNGDIIVCVVEIVEGSQSDNFKTLKVGHIVEKIGRKSVIGLDFERVNKIVKNT